MHEQSAVHLADGYYRASGQPMLAFTSIGPGATNTVIGMATAYVDSTAVALFTGSTAHVHARPRRAPGARAPRTRADNPRIFEPVVKEWWQPSRVDELPFVLHRAWNAMSYRPTRPRPARRADGRPGRDRRGQRSPSRRSERRAAARARTRTPSNAPPGFWPTHAAR